MIDWLGNNPSVVIVLLTLIGSALGWVCNALFAEKKSTKMQESALKILLRRELKTMNDYCSDKGHASNSDMKEFLDTYWVYENLYGENGYAVTIKKDMEELFTKGE